MTFHERLALAVEASGPLCVGIDPHAHLLSAWGLPVSAAGAERFGLQVVEAAAGRAAAVKPQVAFFERFGSAGFQILERILATARQAGLTVIADVKRGDVGSSVVAYAEAWLTPGSPLEVDAITLHPFHGVGSLVEAFAFAAQHRKGAFVLCATSNPEAQGTQSRTGEDGLTLAAAVERDVVAFNVSADGGPKPSIGLVVGATINARSFGLSLTSGAPILAPGFGAQGARFGNFAALYPPDALVLAAASRSLTSDRGRVAAAIERAQSELRR